MKYYFQTQFEGYGIDWSIGNLNFHWYGTQSDYDNEIKKYEARGLRLWTIERTTEKPYDYDNWIKYGKSILLDEEEANRRRVFNKTQGKEAKQRKARYKYLKSSY